MRTPRVVRERCAPRVRAEGCFGGLCRGVLRSRVLLIRGDCIGALLRRLGLASQRRIVCRWTLLPGDIGIGGGTGATVRGGWRVGLSADVGGRRGGELLGLLRLPLELVDEVGVSRRIEVLDDRGDSIDLLNVIMAQAKGGQRQVQGLHLTLHIDVRRSGGGRSLRRRRARNLLTGSCGGASVRCSDCRCTVHGIRADGRVLRGR